MALARDIRDIGQARPPRAATADCRSRALALWPGLDREKLRRTQGEPLRVARLVSRRTYLPLDAILGLLQPRR